MRRPILAGLLTVCLLAGAPGADTLFEEGQKAAAARDYATAMDRFEAALNADPNSLKSGSEYRQAVIAAGAYDRCLAFFKKLATEHPKSANVWLNYGYAHVDKIPKEGAITQVLLANTALTHFSSALALEETWLSLYTRGNSYLYWPAIFGRTPLGIADLEKAVALAKKQGPKPYQAQTWAALGDGHWRLKDLEGAQKAWREGLKLFPGNPDLKARLDRQGEALDAFLDAHFEPGQRVSTDLRVMWDGQGGK